ncbi:hypothetical protein [Sulfitobacter sp. JB4-11]|uniref:hypothetical protein n=1 Tax=Sulfitobacter rhodophyticola TaxID=3238304 RepID=UPI0035199C3E
MKLLLTTVIAAGLASSAIAGTSGGTQDLRIDATAGYLTDKALTTPRTRADVQPRISTRNAAKRKPKYAYSNPLGVGPNNDSR